MSNHGPSGTKPRIMLLVVAGNEAGDAHAAIVSAMELANDYDSVDALVAVSPEARREAQELFGEDAERVVREVKAAGCAVRALAELAMDEEAAGADIFGVIEASYRFTVVGWDEHVRERLSIDLGYASKPDGAMFIQRSRLDAMAQGLTYLVSCHHHDACDISPTEFAGAVGATAWSVMTR